MKRMGNPDEVRGWVAGERRQDAGHHGMPQPQEIIIVDSEALPEAVAEYLAQRVTTVVQAKKVCAAALAGGNTPRSIYSVLASAPFAERLAWPLIQIFFGDERAVPPDHPDSNYAMVRSTLIDRLAKPPVVHRMEAERADLEQAADDYSARLPERLDLLLLGMGEDGHTASLFPDATALHVNDRKVVPATSPKPPVSRLTITPLVIENAHNVVVVVTGSAKANMVARAFYGPLDPVRIPVQLALRGVWFLDRAAACEIA
jgi:6-phosphogluconolactonase